jgi:hypothetical protein
MLFDHKEITPAGKFVTVALVAPVVVSVILLIALLIHTVWLVPATIVFNGLTVIIPVVVVAGGQPPVVVTV